MNLNCSATQTCTNVLRRVARHTNFLDSYDTLNCFLPAQYVETELNPCDYVRNTTTCFWLVQYFNIMDLYVCTLGIKKTILGKILVLILTVVLFAFLIAHIIMLARYFIVPNLITIFSHLDMCEYNYGVTVVAVMFSIPEIIREGCSCIPDFKDGSLYISEFIGKSLSLFAFGMMILGFYHHYDFDVYQYIGYVILYASGLVYILIVLNIKLDQQQKQSEVTNPIDMVLHASICIVLYLGYIIYYIMFNKKKPRGSRMSSRLSSVIDATPRPTYLGSTLDDEQRSQATMATMPDGKTRPNRQQVAAKPTIPAQGAAGRKPPGQPDAQSAARPVEAPAVPKVVSVLDTAATKIEDTKSWEVLKYTLNPFKHLHNWGIFFTILCTPLFLFNAIIIPVVSWKRPLKGWCKYLVCLSILIYPWYYYKFKLNVIALYVLAGLVLAILAYVIIFTRANRTPPFYDLLSVYGAFIGFQMINFLDYEISVMMWQLLNYFGNWQGRHIIIVTFSLGSVMTEIVLCYTFIERKFNDMAFGLICGLTIFTVLMTMPSVSFQICDTDSVPSLAVNDITSSAFIFQLLLIPVITFGLLMTNWQLRRSQCCVIGIICLLFYLHVILVVHNRIHPFGTIHMSNLQVAYHSDWA